MVRFSVQVSAFRLPPGKREGKMERLMFGTLYCRDYETARDVAATLYSALGLSMEDDTFRATIMAHVHHRDGSVKFPAEALKDLADTLHDAAEEVLTSPTIKRVK
jgi:hypothetical protein